MLDSDAIRVPVQRDTTNTRCDNLLNAVRLRRRRLQIARVVRRSGSTSFPIRIRLNDNLLTVVPDLRSRQEERNPRFTPRQSLLEPGRSLVLGALDNRWSPRTVRPILVRAVTWLRVDGFVNSRDGKSDARGNSRVAVSQQTLGSVVRIHYGRTVAVLR